MKDFYHLRPHERSTVKTLITQFTTIPSSTLSSHSRHYETKPVALDIEYVHPIASFTDDKSSIMSYPIMHSLAVVDHAYRLPIFMIADLSHVPLFSSARAFRNIETWVSTHNTHRSSLSEMRNMVVHILHHNNVIMWDSEKDVQLLNLHDYKHRITDISVPFVKTNGQRCGLRPLHKFFFGFDPMTHRDPRASAEATMRIFQEASWMPGARFDNVSTNRELDRHAAEDGSHFVGRDA